MGKGGVRFIRSRRRMVSKQATILIGYAIAFIDIGTEGICKVSAEIITGSCHSGCG